MMQSRDSADSPEKPVEKRSDKYGSYQELSRAEENGIDYKLSLRKGTSGVAIMAPHGGNIEPGTTEIADASASDDHTFYSFQGIKTKGNRTLHLKSTQFDEPLGLAIAEGAKLVFTIHGCRSTEQVVYIGGLNEDLKGRVRDALEGAGFGVSERSEFQGKSSHNICNMGQYGSGVQLEITMALRDAMFENLTTEGRKHPTEIFDRFIAAVKQTIRDYLQSSLTNQDHRMSMALRSTRNKG